MPKPPPPTLPKPALPQNNAFDPWNSSSTGHQRPEQQPGTGWRDSRNKKLNAQFQAGPTGGHRISDTWGPGAENYDSKLKAVVPSWVAGRKGRSVVDMLKKPGLMKASLGPDIESDVTEEGRTAEEALVQKRKRADEEEKILGKGGVFAGCVVYVNGSTYPLVSDHKLKHILSENGARMSLHLGRRQVTHVILGRAAGGGLGAGGGLAGGKMEREIRRVAGCGVVFVGVEWVLESLKAGKRLPEARFSNLKVAPKGQGSVYKLYSGSASEG